MAHIGGLSAKNPGICLGIRTDIIRKDSRNENG